MKLADFFQENRETDSAAFGIMFGGLEPSASVPSVLERCRRAAGLERHRLLQHDDHEGVARFQDMLVCLAHTFHRALSIFGYPTGSASAFRLALHDQIQQIHPARAGQLSVHDDGIEAELLDQRERLLARARKFGARHCWSRKKGFEIPARAADLRRQTKCAFS